MSVIRIAFLGTPEFARFHLASLLEDPHFEVVGVVTQPDRPSGRNMHLTPSPVKKLAQERGLKVITPESIKMTEALSEISSWKAEAAVVVAYGQIVPQNFLDLFPLRVVNVHGSLLPRWRGAAPIQRAIMAGDLETGVCLQVMVKKLDAGDIIGSYNLKIDDEMDAISLHDHLMPLGAQLLRIEFMDYLRGNLTPLKQDEAKVTYSHKIDKSESHVDWKKPSREIFNHVRGMLMGPGSFAELGGKKIKLHKVEIAEEKSRTPGEVLRVGDGNIIVSCGQGSLRILEVQPESRPRMKVKDFLLGYPLKVGDQFL